MYLFGKLIAGIFDNILLKKGDAVYFEKGAARTTHSNLDKEAQKRLKISDVELILEYKFNYFYEILHTTKISDYPKDSKEMKDLLDYVCKETKNKYLRNDILDVVKAEKFYIESL